MKADTRDLRLGRGQQSARSGGSRERELAESPMVHFATHGVLAGELHGGDGHGLMLTPPEKRAWRMTDTYRPARSLA